MASIEKLIDKMKVQPNGISLQEAERVLISYGYTFLRQRGSHRSYRNDSGEMIIIIANNPLKKVYVAKILERIGENKYSEETMNIKEYLELPYHIVIQNIIDENGSYYFATVKEFDGCMSHGDTYSVAFENIREAMELWIEGKLEGGFDVPLPIGENQYSGKFVLRIPKSLHARLAAEAEKEGVSLNQYALYRLSI